MNLLMNRFITASSCAADGQVRLCPILHEPRAVNELNGSGGASLSTPDPVTKGPRCIREDCKSKCCANGEKRFAVAFRTPWGAGEGGPFQMLRPNRQNGLTRTRGQAGRSWGCPPTGGGPGGCRRTGCASSAGTSAPS